MALAGFLAPGPEMKCDCSCGSLERWTLIVMFRFTLFNIMPAKKIAQKPDTIVQSKRKRRRIPLEHGFLGVSVSGTSIDAGSSQTGRGLLGVDCSIVGMFGSDGLLLGRRFYDNPCWLRRLQLVKTNRIQLKRGGKWR